MRWTNVRSILKFFEAQLEKLLEILKAGGRVYIAAEPKIAHAVVAQRGAIKGHLSSNRHVGVPIEHFVSDQIQRSFGPAHVGTHEVKRSDGQQAGHRTNQGLHRRWSEAHEAASQ